MSCPGGRLRWPHVVVDAVTLEVNADAYGASASRESRLRLSSFLDR